jgi:uncharacterized protein
MNAINWFEIPTRNLVEAKRFYEQILGQALTHDLSIPGFKLAVLPYTEPGVGGALVEAEQFRPHADGVRIYLNGGNDLATILGRVPAAGGKVVMEKTFLRKDIGHIGMFSDPDGNIIGLHSPN